MDDTKIGLVVDILDEQSYLAVCHNLHTACQLFVAGEPSMSDEDYDSVKGQLAQYEAANPEMIVNWSPVGKPLGGVNDGVVPNQLEKFMVGAMLGGGDGSGMPGQGNP
jgi:NAD-dependent DNA ligase